MKKTKISPLFFVAISLTSVVYGQSWSELNQQLDFDSSGNLQLEDEVLIGILHQVRPKLGGKPIDLTKLRSEGKKRRISLIDLKPTELESKMLELGLRADGNGLFFESGGEKMTYALTDINPEHFGLTKVSVPDEPENTTDRLIRGNPSFKIRRSEADLNTGSLKHVGSFNFSYGDNRVSDREQWKAQGVVRYSIPWVENSAFVRDPKAPALNSFLQNASLNLTSVIDKVDTGGGDEGEVDSLVIKAGPSVLFNFGDGFDRSLDGVRVAANFDFGTDFDLKTKIVGGSLDFTPIRGITTKTNSGLQFNSTQEKIVGLPVYVRPTFVTHIEGGTVSDDGGDEDLIGKSDYFRVGPNIGLSFVPGNFEAIPISLSVGYLHYWELTGNSEDAHAWRAGIEYHFTSSENLSLKFDYTDGVLPVTLENDRSVGVGLGIKF